MTRVDSPVSLMHHDPDRSWITDPDLDYPKGTQPVIKSFTYSEGENANDWRMVMGKMEKHCIVEVNEIYERYCFNKRDKQKVHNFVTELKTLVKNCNFCDCLRDSLICDRILLGIKNEQTTKKFLRMRNLTMC